jgi:hypothetical protein
MTDELLEFRSSLNRDFSSSNQGCLNPARTIVLSLSIGRTCATGGIVLSSNQCFLKIGRRRNSYEGIFHYDHHRDDVRHEYLLLLCRQQAELSRAYALTRALMCTHFPNCKEGDDDGDEEKEEERARN